jgi:hypothetical protein
MCQRFVIVKTQVPGKADITDTREFLRKLLSQVCRYLISYRSKSLKLLRFQVLTAANIKMSVFWDAAPCSIAENSEVLDDYDDHIDGARVCL